MKRVDESIDCWRAKITQLLNDLINSKTIIAPTCLEELSKGCGQSRV